MTRKAAVLGLKITEPTLAKIEGGDLNFRRNPGELRALLKRYGVTDEELVEQFVELNRESLGDDWFTAYRPIMPAGMPHFVGLEGEATGIKAYHPQMVHGLLQTEAYAKALFEEKRPVEDTTREFVERHVELRMERKRRVLARGTKLRVVLGEAALRNVVGDTEVMQEQYREIIDMAKSDNNQIQVLPFGPGYKSSSDFAVLDLGELPARVQADNAWGAVSTSDKPREVDRFNRRFEAMVGVALDIEATIVFLEKLMKR